MDRKAGIDEELLRADLTYPDNKQVYPLHPRAYAAALLQQAFREIGTEVSQRANDGDHASVLRIINELRAIALGSSPELATPLQAVHYRHDADLLPVYPELFLSSPKLINNHGVDSLSLFKTLKFELMTADAADFMVSFIRWSGLQLLLRAFDEVVSRGKKIRVLTSTYLNVTEPKALKALLAMNGVEVRLYDSGRESFHTKAYIFRRDSGRDTVIIGSSNLSMAAGETGHEWNVKLPNVPHLPIFAKATTLFNQMWEEPKAHPLTEPLLAAYEHHRNLLESATVAQKRFAFAAQPEPVIVVDRPPVTDDWVTVVPNGMQEDALAALDQTRADGNAKGIIIAATGTGKTYLAALDARNFEAQRLLFVAHRDELLEKAKETFEHVFQQPGQCGKLTGTEKDWDSPFLFSTVQTLSRDAALGRFPATHFDYIVIDEFHHADAESYRKLLDRFQPKFLLGLTATPERMDGGNVLELCDYNVVYEIRLRDALAEGLLAPFHYFGLHDPTVDYDSIPEKAGVLDEAALDLALQTAQRVDYVIGMVEKFGYSGDRMIALGFCATIQHAKFMADACNARGYHAAYVTGNDTPQLRQATMQRLEREDDPLSIIFTVNVFNEGVDIPSVNLVLFLRPTESATIFMQQLGRGLRKSAGKEYVTVLDFIGNYRKSFVVPLALAGQLNHRAFDRDSLRVAVEREFSDLPEGSLVDLAEIPRQQILAKIETVRMDTRQMLLDLYQQFKRGLGRAPELEDFLYSDAAPSLEYFIRKYHSWVETKAKMQDLSPLDEQILHSGVHLELVQRLERMLPAKWPYELVILSVAFQHGHATTGDILTELSRRFHIADSLDHHQVIIQRAMDSLATPSAKQKWAFGSRAQETFIVEPALMAAWHQPWCEAYLQERLEYGIVQFRRQYRPELFFSVPNGVIPYQNYSRSEVKFLFQADGEWREGVSRVGNDYVLFVNLNKGKTVADHLQYHDYFVDHQHFHWQSQNATAHHSERGKDYVHQQARGIHIHLFVRKFVEMHGVTLPFTYLGEIACESSHGDQPMNITWRLQQPVPDDLFADLIR